MATIETLKKKRDALKNEILSFGFDKKLTTWLKVNNIDYDESDSFTIFDGGSFDIEIRNVEDTFTNIIIDDSKVEMSLSFNSDIAEDRYEDEKPDDDFDEWYKKGFDDEVKSFLSKEKIKSLVKYLKSSPFISSIRIAGDDHVKVLYKSKDKPIIDLFKKYNIVAMEIVKLESESFNSFLGGVIKKILKRK